MTVIDAPTFSEPSTRLPFLELRARLDQAITDGATEQVDEIVASIDDSVGAAIAARAIDDLAELRAHIVRLQRRISRLNADKDLIERTVNHLQSLDRVVDSGRTAALMLAASEARHERVGLLRDEILQLLSQEPMRPRELAERFGCDPSQVSRALRSLKDDGLITQVVNESDESSDRRANWYAATSVAGSSGLTPVVELITRGVRRVSSRR